MPGTQPSFRVSPYIDFNTGEVSLDPDSFADNLGTPPWKLDEKMNFFQCRIEVWQLSPAVLLLKGIEANKQKNNAWCHAAYGLLFTLTSYFEMIGKIIRPGSQPWRHSEQDFNHGFCHVYPNIPITQPDTTSNQDRYHDNTIRHVAEIRDLMRNGIAHLGFTKRNFAIHNSDNYQHDFEVQPVTNYPAKPTGFADLYLMNPHKVTRTIVGHFGKFMDELRLPAQSDRQKKFEEFVGRFHDPNSKET